MTTVATGKPRILLVEELRLNQEAFSRLIRVWREFDFVGSASTAREALEITARDQPDLVLLDFYFSHVFSLDLIQQLRAKRENVRSVLLVRHIDARKAISLALHGAVMLRFPNSSWDDVRRTLYQAYEADFDQLPLLRDRRIGITRREAAGDCEESVDELSAVERQIYLMFIEGFSPKIIATRLHLGPRAVDYFRASIMRKLKVSDFAGLMRMAINRERMVTCGASGWIDEAANSRRSR